MIGRAELSRMAQKASVREPVQEKDHVLARLLRAYAEAADVSITVEVALA